MPDIHSPQTRSYNMSRIRSRDTGPEMLLRRWLFSRGFRYRLHDKRLPGS
jgi:DNA mismatch endonuclease (patch repair protein)